ncbi:MULTISPECIES: sulfide/dihydroorotate dehydrogenase-like FAD/NAD-binding protein [Clostridium]|uniref:Sulfide dehydrogenase (Flavoprotein) subunit SudB n=1 Tax=Clostridium cadaveris TaxID=1529 RepID=A0A1I2LA90_9CLOT|nr:sulfide/dihydroorotate dehydrogenase-like FAD/NAD-binding protein [Clostridium cadaveris]MDU4951693.1 sulfide/dihydroorotate dehydrogenase-like FAD/NAD-binding protein [Clostridium sp.]MDM8311310.1 sulfide/dihydroorotate dehydrogenase-like FAD/NAD-binding protein [Clostridium cadaveris]MDY4948416.1 sulfide/dihydroorotate dehydrogenase-like FAD/NAD-binding protein [Clostridium cadaveris]NME64706.1 sulfide/dihydroorotate dehydrogenase-like FAD/NAD-binding protein [Clostridium cadaveris]NWK096
MYKILKKRFLAQNIYLMDVEAPRVAKSCHPGQFIIVKMDEKGERIPLTICDYNRETGSVTIVFQALGESTKEMLEYNEGDYFKDFVGPLGRPSEFVHEDLEELKKKKIVFVAGGVGAAPVYPQVKWLHEQGIAVDVIVGAKTKDLVILEEEMKNVSGNLYVTTDDGSYGFKGMVTAQLEELVNQGNKYDLCVAIGPMIMMKFVCLLTKKLEIPTIVSLNPIMVDGTGMCGACRVTVGDEVKFACVDGPEFDGHLVNFDEAMRRQTMYKTEEGRKLLKMQEGDTHHGGCGFCGGDK